MPRGRRHDQAQRHWSDPRSIGRIYECLRRSAGVYMSNLVEQRNQGQLAAAKQKVTDLESEIAALGKTTKASASLQNN